MECEDVLDRIEALADGDETDAQVSRHVQQCAHCAAALARARQIHHALEALPVPLPPPAFTARVVTHARSISWQSEQRLDWWFNASMAAGMAIVAVGIWGLLNITGLTAVTVGTADFVGRSVPALYDQVKPALRLYLTAATAVAGGLGLWWWIERSGRPQRTA